MKFTPDTEQYLLESIKRFFSAELDEEIGDLNAGRVLEFCTREIAPSVYNQAIADAQMYFSDKVADLAGVHFEAEYDYWKKGTRLVLRMRVDGTETGVARWMWNRLLNFGGALFSHKTLVGIKRTAEALAQ